MIPNRVIFLILLTLCALTASAQEHLSFRPDTWDFGTIRETDGRVSHTFTGVNRGDSPLVILDVVTTCGCTVPDFSKKPILPGEKTQITVTYDPANRPGSFTKELWVYSSEKRKIATLTVQGSVIPRQKTVEELYPVDAGGGLRLASTLNAFSYIYPGRQVQAAIGYANTSKRPVRLELRPETTSGALRTVYPKQIAPGERGEINFTYLIPADKPRYGTVRDALEVLIDGRSNGTTLVTHGIGVDPQPADATQNAPKADFSENILKFGPVKHAGPVRKKHFTLSNAGGAELIVRAVEGEGHVATTLAPGQKIAPGDALRNSARSPDAGLRHRDRTPRGGDQRPRAAHAAHPGDGNHRRVTHKHTTDIMYPILEKRLLAEGIWLMKVLAPRVARSAQPGQFVIVRVDEHGERIPLTISDFDAAEGSVTIVTQAIGASTRKICALNEGDALADFAGPLGHPSEFVKMPVEELRKRRYLFVAGGVGTAPVYPQVKWLRKHGVKADVIIGAKTRDMLIYTDAMRAVAENLHIATDDGSEGFKGLVTALIGELIEKEGRHYDECVAIGPMIMMKFVALTTKKYALKTTVSLNALMVDGTGMCGACRVTVGGRTRFTCVDGPEFDAHEVDFDEAMRRQGMYRTQEQRAAAIEAEREAGHVCKIGLDK